MTPPIIIIIIIIIIVVVIIKINTIILPAPVPPTYSPRRARPRHCSFLRGSGASPRAVPRTAAPSGGFEASSRWISRSRRAGPTHRRRCPLGEGEEEEEDVVMMMVVVVVVVMVVVMIMMVENGRDKMTTLAS
jgi:hypothetical protein